MELRLWRILIDAVGTEEGFIELATTLATTLVTVIAVVAMRSLARRLSQRPPLGK